jgi:hypothetical protein
MVDGVHSERHATNRLVAIVVSCLPTPGDLVESAHELEGFLVLSRHTWPHALSPRSS